MTDEEYNELVRFAKDEPDSRFSIFMQRTAGYRFFGESPICIPKFILYAKYRGSNQLFELEKGTHPKYRRVYKDGFDKIQEELWNKKEEE